MGLKFGLKNCDLQGLVPLSGSLLLCIVKTSAVGVLQPAARVRRRQRGKMLGSLLDCGGKALGERQGRTSRLTRF